MSSKNGNEIIENEHINSLKNGLEKGQRSKNEVEDEKDIINSAKC